MRAPAGADVGAADGDTSSLGPQEYVDYNGGAGVQHIALKTADIITAVRAASGPSLCPAAPGTGRQGSPGPTFMAWRPGRLSGSAGLLIPAPSENKPATGQ